MLLGKEERLHRLLYPGSFNPITIGHLDLIERAGQLCDEIVIAVMTSGAKQATASLLARQEIIKQAVQNLHCKAKITIISYEGLLATLYDEIDADAVVRGIRNQADYVYEQTMTVINRELNSNFETVFLAAKPELAHISSSLVREMRRLGNDYQAWIPEGTYELVEKSLSESDRIAE